jgi:hypothetical protein
MRTGLVLIVLVLNVAAITAILGAPLAAGRKLVWCAAVILLPFAGALGWLVVSRSRRPRSAPIT